MKKEEAVDKAFNDANYQTRSESDKEKERIENIKDSARPALLKRIGAGLLDFLFSASLFALLLVIITPKSAKTPTSTDAPALIIAVAKLFHLLCKQF